MRLIDTGEKANRPQEAGFIVISDMKKNCMAETNSETGNTPAADEQTKSRQQLVYITLDAIPAGNDSNDFGKNERYSKILPDGVTSKMLYMDLLRIGWPALLELMLTQMTGMFDLMQVGVLGSYAIVGVGVANQVKMLMMTVFMSLNVGVMSLIARARGAKDMEQARFVLRQGLLLNFVASSVVAVVGYFLAPALVQLLASKDDPAAALAAVQYIQINMMGFLPLSLTSIATAALRGMGNSRISLIYNTVANVVNIFLNWTMINGNLGFPKMEVIGAALATVIGQSVAFIMAVFAITNKHSFLSVDFKKGFRPDKNVLSNIVRIGIPAAAEQLIMRFGVFVYIGMINSLGTIAGSTHQVCVSLQSLTFMNGQAFGVAATSLVGQSLGKRRPDMAQAYGKRCQTTGMIVAFCIGAAFVIFRENLIWLYDKDPQVIAFGGYIMMVIAVIQPFMSSQLVLSGAMRGAGDTKAVAVISSVTVLVVRPILTFIALFLLNLGVIGAWYVMGIDQLVRAFFVHRRYVSGKWKSSFQMKTQSHS